jgi:hypothetical protein
MKLDARLVAKIITASYHTADDSNVPATNPFNLFHDPEFLKLNPGVQWPDGSPGNHPILLGDESDLTYELTRWLNANKQARAFLDGKPDPWGTTVNAAYKGIKLPVSSFPSLDVNQSTNFQPITGLDATSQQLAAAQFPGGYLDTTSTPPATVKYPRQNPGSREVIGIIDAADAEDFLMHTAALQNAAGNYVLPTNGNVLAAASHMTAAPNGVTRQLDLANRDPHAYPLAIESDAIVPTDGPKAEREQIAKLLTYTTGAGQTPGSAFGQLPNGYVPLPSDLRAQARHAIIAVLAGVRTGSTSTPGGHRNQHGGSTTDSSPTTSPAGSRTQPPVTIPPFTSTQASGAPLGSSPVVAPVNTVLDAVKDITSGRTTIWWLLIVGALTFLAGPTVLWGRRPSELLAKVPSARVAHWRSPWPRR